MPTYKVLAQSAPSATTATTLYTATSATIVSTLNVANTGGAADTIRIAVRPAGATLANQHYIAYGVQVPSGSLLAITSGITLANTDVMASSDPLGTCTLVAADAENKLVTLSNASAITLTVPPSIFTVGQQINIAQIGAGQVTLAQGAGVTITSTGASASAPKCRAQYSAATIICTASNTFLVVGDLA